MTIKGDVSERVQKSVQQGKHLTGHFRVFGKMPKHRSGTGELLQKPNRLGTCPKTRLIPLHHSIEVSIGVASLQWNESGLFREITLFEHLVILCLVDILR